MGPAAHETIELNPETAVKQLERFAERAKLSKNGMARLLKLKHDIDGLAKELAEITLTHDPIERGKRIVEELKNAEGGSLTGPELKDAYNLNPAVLHRRRIEFRVVYWRDAKHDFHYPRWQFNQAGALLPGIQEILRCFKSQDEWRIMRYFLSPRLQLGNRSPLELIREGRIDRALTHAREHAEENTW